MLYLLVSVTKFFHNFPYFSTGAYGLEVLVDEIHNRIARIDEFISIYHGFNDFFDSVELAFFVFLVADQVL